ncbi:cation diffusion facilitator family transporter [Pyrococcus yayanosii]|uniref:Cobalt/zinc/cadmium cation efflux pump protein n=1 Tax=Pyrococcus yayanosii (strain CH1 / JCM 16557) TaxID=529709 RepID=F8AGP5_PYRYC|nr:cation diffusion facilitator family transporter [Pyrococcus yayanosii]AEH24019.1 cobalt/zinc/cadmium cation efflux pump protein [Pyrococcus yayanosii CH1]
MEEAYKPIAVSIVGNLLLAALKIAVGIISSSIALISDGIHSLSDLVTSVIGFVGIRISKKPPDSTHPFGHSRFEPLFAFFMGELLLLAAYEIGRDSLERIIRGVPIEVTPVMIGVALISILLKEAMTQYTLAVGKRLNNSILIADAYHHRSDVLSTVAVLIGLILEKGGMAWGDGVAGVIVSLFIAKVAIEIILENVHYLTGKAPPLEVCKKIEEAALSVPNVLGVHDLRAHYVGSRLHVELHIEVPPMMTLKEAHDISEEVKKKIERLPEVEVAFVHVDIKGVTT